MKHYEVSSVYETLNHQWVALWGPNLISQTNKEFSRDFCKSKLTVNSQI